MLQSINDKLKGWITWIIILGVGAIFVLTGISYFFVSGAVSPQSVAKVGDREISQALYRQSLQQAIAVNRSADQKALQKQTLNSLIDQALLQQDAEQSGIIITEQALSNAIFAIPAFQETGKYNAKKFSEIAKYYGGPAAIKSMIAANLLASSIVTPIVQSSFVLNQEQQFLEALEGQKRDIRYYAIDPKDFEHQVSPTEAALLAYYNTHKADYHVPEKVLVSYAILSSAQFVDMQAITDREIQQYYQQNKAILVDKEKRSGEIITLKHDAGDRQAIIEALRTGKALTPAMKKQVSIQTIAPISSAEAKTYSDFVLFQLTKSAPLKALTANEYVVLSDIIPPQPMTFNTSKPIIRKILANRKAFERFNAVLTDVNHSAFNEVVQSNQLKMATSKAFKLGEKAAGIEGNVKLQQAVFTKHKTQGFIIQTDTSGIIYHVDRMIPAHTLNFSEVKDQVKAAYVAENAHKLAEAFASQLKAQLNKSQKPGSREKAHTEQITREADLPKLLITSVYRAPLKQYQVIKNGQDFWVVAVTRVLEGKRKISDDVIQNTYAEIEASDYIQALRHEIKVTINPAVVNA